MITAKNLFQTLLILLIASNISAQQGSKLKLWYAKPAIFWNEALPIGNGRLGAMVYGDPVNEKIQLNEGTFWSGGPSRNDNPDALSALPGIRKLIFDGNYSTLESLINKNITAKQLHGSMYQPVGFLNLSFPGHSSYTNYYRELDLEKAIFTTTYKLGEITYKREVFASQPDQVIVVRLSANQTGKLTFSASVNGPLQKTAKTLDQNTLEMTGLSSTNEGVTGQVKFDARVKILNTGGTKTIATNKINVTNADEVIILISMATNFVDYKTLTANEIEKCTKYLSNAESKTYTELLNNHESAYQKYFNRVSLNLGTSSMSSYPTDVRIKNFSKTKDNELVAMYYQFGRYLLISSSQPGGTAATLQGLWNDQLYPAWDSKYTLNINAEMNYWPAEKCNLSELHEPFFKMVKELSETGQKTAKDMYGCDGWVAHHNTDIWRITGLIDGAYWGMWPMGGAWTSQHLWERYLYSGDLNFLENAYPILKSACQFYQDFLIAEPKHNWLVVSPSNSPENNPSVHSTSVCAGATMDNQLLFDLFTKTIKTANLLKKDSALMLDFKKILDRLAPMQIGRLGQLQEWMDDWDSPTDHNRHVSHLYGLFPSNQISPYTSPQLFDAARTSLNYRGDASTGWSMGWKVNFWARLLDGNHALKLITDQLTLVDPAIMTVVDGGGTYPNLFDAHPPFQIDGNFGCTSGITEMLLQTQDGAINIIPALPDNWKSGSINGFRTYGGFEVGFKWENGEIQTISIKSNLGGNCRIRVPNTVDLADSIYLKIASGENPNPFFKSAAIKDPLISSSAKLNKVVLKKTLLYDFLTEAGQTYNIVSVENLGFSNAKVEKNPKQLIVNFTQPVAKQSTYSGFSVKLGSAVPAEIGTVLFDESANQLLINLKNNILSIDSIFLTYQNGNVLSNYMRNLDSFTDTLVDNLLAGSSPRLIDASTSVDGKKLVLQFNKKMEITTIADNGLLLKVTYNGTKNFALTEASFFENDSTRLCFTIDPQLFADYALSISYSGTKIESKDNGLLSHVKDMPVKNNSIGLPPQFQSSSIDVNGLSISLKFNKPLAEIIDQTKYFKFYLNDQEIVIADLYAKDKTLVIVPTRQIRYGDVIKVTYSDGKISSPDGGSLANFDGLLLANTIKEPVWKLIPGKTEAEKYATQFGVQTESTSDTGGGLDVGWIDNNDWFEYPVNISSDTTYIATFRLATPGDNGLISILIDNEKIGSVTVPNTGGYQTWKSVTKELKLKKGKHYLKLIAVSAGFNINWFSFEKKSTTGISSFGNSGLRVFPNPAKNELFIESGDFIYNKIEVSDLSGKEVFAQSTTSTNKSQINLSLPTGYYILNLTNQRQFRTTNFVIE